MREPRPDDRVYVIAEAGVNHNGDPERALAMVDVAAEAGADAVKFQTFHTEDLTTAAAAKAAYQETNTGAAGSQQDMLRDLEIDADAHRKLQSRCAEKGVAFLSTPFDLKSLRFLVGELGIDTVKIGSGEITNGPLLLAAARTGKDIVLSTGMSTLEEVREALAILAFGLVGWGDAAPCRSAFEAAFASAEGQKALRRHVTVLHCTTEYPAPFEEVNLRAMETLSKTFGLPVGFSDHTDGIAVAIAAAALGAVVIEKHFTLDHALPGPDHVASLEPDELAAMVAGIRHVEAALGDGVKKPTPSEMKNMAPARKSLVALCAIHAGEAFTPENLGAKRPGSGCTPLDYWDWLGCVADRDYATDEIIGR